MEFKEFSDCLGMLYKLDFCDFFTSVYFWCLKFLKISWSVLYSRRFVIKAHNMFLVLVCQKFDAVENIFNLNVKVESATQRGFTAVLLIVECKMLYLRQNSFSQQLEMGKITCLINTFKSWKYWSRHASLKDSDMTNQRAPIGPFLTLIGH